MIIKKFEAETQEEAILKAKDELGSGAVVMNIKTTKPKGVFKFMKKPVVEVTAAVDENVDRPKTRGQAAVTAPTLQSVNAGKATASQGGNPDVTAIEKKLNDLENLLAKQMKERNADSRAIEAVKKSVDSAKADADVYVGNDGGIFLKDGLPSSDSLSESLSEDVADIENKDNMNACMKLIYDQLIGNDVDEKYVNELTGELSQSIRKDAGIDAVLAAVYQKLVLKLGSAETIERTPGKAKYVFFVGPTGVGKTTTIAKIASLLKLKQGLDVALLTADTYRIAAVEQLRTYANILGIPISVVYSAAEITDMKTELDKHEVVLIDTAGRSDKNADQINDLKMMLRTIPEDNKETYLVLSATTKEKDLIRIADVYKEIADIRLIFTKLDETETQGSIYNIRMHTGAPLSYMTFGQNVPDDIETANAQNIAKQLLSGT